MREDGRSIKVEEACKLAYEFFNKNGFQKGIVFAAELDDLWLFGGKMLRGSGVEYGNNPVSVNKKNGNVNWFVLSRPKNLELYWTRKEVPVPERYRYRGII